MKNLKMKKINLFIIFFILCGYSGKAQQAEVLSNKIIVEMYTKKLPKSIIIGKIKVSKNNFDVNTDALISLTESKVPEDIINAMVEAANDDTKHVEIIDPNNPLDMHDTGVYYFAKNGEKSELVQLEPTIYSQNKSRGGFMSAMTYGISKVKMSATIDGKNAHFQLNDTSPVFYFYFDISGNSISQTSDWWFSAATSPNEFLLVKLTENSKTREVTTASASIISGSSSGVEDDNKISFKVEKVSRGIYKVFFDKPISGEYCFMYAGSVPAGFTPTNKVFDFGIAKN
jgi:hypothetical protein